MAVTVDGVTLFNSDGRYGFGSCCYKKDMIDGASIAGKSKTSFAHCFLADKVKYNVDDTKFPALFL